MTSNDYRRLTPEEIRQDTLARIEKLRPLDDTLIRQLLRDDIELTQLILRIITNIDDLTVTSYETQFDMHRLVGARSLCLDAKATDSQGRIYNLEVEKHDERATPKRARYHSSAMDVEYLGAGEKFETLPIKYVIFMTENDVFQANEPIYIIERQNKTIDQPFGDGEHIIFVNCAYESDSYDTDLLKLIHDFRCNKADDMLIGRLADKTKQCKEINKGADSMCKIIEEGERKAAMRNSGEIAMNMLADGELSHEKISKLTGVPLEVVEEFAKEMKSVSK